MNADVFQATIKYYMTVRHITTNEKLRKHTTVGSNTTFGKYLKDPELMPIGVFEQIMNSLNVPKEDRFKLFND